VAQGLAGWYPDPGGAGGRYRYWDGMQWSAETTDDPRHPPPTPRALPQRRSPAFWIVAAAAVLAVLLIVVVAVGTALGGIGPITAPPNPQPTAVGGNDSSPSPTPTPNPTPPATTTPSRSASPSRSSGTPASLVPCPYGIPNQRAPHPVDNRVYGGNLSFPAEPSFRPAADEPRISFAWDVSQQSLSVDDIPWWIAQLAVGQLRASDGFVHDPRNTAESVLQCALTGDMYEEWTPARTDRRSKAVTIDGRQGWMIDSNITVSAPGLDFPGDRTVVVVVRDNENWGMFFGAVPIGDADLNAALDRTVASLQAT
jgi:Protein of unknown function (DUF2510)